MTPRSILDLHGYTVATAQEALAQYLSAALEKQEPALKIITGVGHHPNADSRRGILFKALPRWLNASPFKPHIHYLLKGMGFYEVVFKVDPQDEDTRNERGFPFLLQDNSLHEKITLFSKINLLVKHIVAGDVERDRVKIGEILDDHPSLLYQTSQEGLNVLMVAAIFKQIKTIEFLLKEEKNRSLKPQLLKHQQNDGTNILMVAVRCNHRQVVRFLLKTASSLLKQRCFDGSSVFTVASQLQNPIPMLELLYTFLRSHHRERGYTDLRREYKHLLKDILRKETLA